MKSKYQCRICGSENTLNLGKLPKQTHFAGRLLENRLKDSFLYKCNDCLLNLRNPILSKSQYNILYAQANSDVWSQSYIPFRQDQAIVKSLILKLTKNNSTILDVGCYTAEFLSTLPDSYEKYGIEMSLDASTVAKKKGVKVIGNDLYNFKTDKKFDVITAIDVIEHTENPEEFIESLSLLLEPSGKIFISTGNADSWLWLHLKNKFWYSKYPEHISFIGDLWLSSFCRKNNFNILEKKFFKYKMINNKSSLFNLIKLFLALLRINPERLSNCTKDHFCFVISKNI